MLSINFFSNGDYPPHSIRVVDQFYEWLARSEFASVGQTAQVEIEVDEEPVNLPLVRLDDFTRQSFIQTLSETFFQETRRMLGEMERGLATEGLGEQAHRLRLLLEMLDCLKNPAYEYLQRE